MAIISATDVRAGALIERDGRLWRVSRAKHVHVGGRGGAYMQVEAKDVETGAKSNIRLRTDEKVERPFVERRDMRCLYQEDGGFVCMDEQSYEQLTLPSDLFEGREGFLIADTVVGVNFHEGRPIGVEMPSAVVLEVSQTEPQAKNATASSSYKPAVMETGVTVMVPAFIGTGEKIRVNTDTGDYAERA